MSRGVAPGILSRGTARRPAGDAGPTWRRLPGAERPARSRRPAGLRRRPLAGGGGRRPGGRAQRPREGVAATSKVARLRPQRQSRCRWGKKYLMLHEHYPWMPQRHDGVSVARRRGAASSGGVAPAGEGGGAPGQSLVPFSGLLAAASPVASHAHRRASDEDQLPPFRRGRPGHRARRSLAPDELPRTRGGLGQGCSLPASRPRLVGADCRRSPPGPRLPRPRGGLRAAAHEGAAQGWAGRISQWPLHTGCFLSQCHGALDSPQQPQRLRDEH